MWYHLIPHEVDVNWEVHEYREKVVTKMKELIVTCKRKHLVCYRKEDMIEINCDEEEKIDIDDEESFTNEIDVDDRTIDSHIKRLRRKFRLVDPEFEQIETLYGIGYRFRNS